MKVIGLDGRNYAWKLVNHVPLNNDDLQRSSLHIQARELLRSIYPLDRILEEVSLPGSNGLAIDFYIPVYKLAVEVQGEQHYEYILYFHGSPSGFLKSKQRDKDKKHWLELNTISLVEFPHNESTEQWRERLRTREIKEDRQAD
jgi:hypothetical protein